LVKTGILAKASLYFTTTMKSSLFKDWFYGCLCLTNEFLDTYTTQHILMRIPLQLITRIETLSYNKNGNQNIRKNENRMVVDGVFFPCNYKVGFLSIENYHPHMLGYKCPDSLLIAGPTSIFDPFWSKLCKRLEEVNLFNCCFETGELNMTAFKILSLLSTGITSVREITSILNINDDDALNFFHQLYKNKLINLSVRLTSMGYKTIKTKGFYNQFNGAMLEKGKKRRIIRYYPVYYTT